MDDKQRLYKKIFIAAIYAVLWLGVGTAIYFFAIPEKKPPVIEPIIKPVETIWSQSFISGPELYSAAAKILNPNPDFGASGFRYAFSLYDDAGNLLTAKTGESFIWPGESKYLVLGGINLSKAPAKTLLQIYELNWQEVKNFGGVDLTLSGKSFQKSTPQSRGGSFFTAGAVAVNNTPYVLDKVYVSAVVFDATGSPIAVNSTVLDSLKGRERRAVSLVWFSDFAGAPADVDLNISTNLWDRPELLQ